METTGWYPVYPIWRTYDLRTQKPEHRKSLAVEIKKRGPAKASKRRAASAKRPRLGSPSREAILQTAITHFVEKGYDGARIDEIVSDTNTSKNLVYHYFRSKEELFVAALDRVYEQFSRQRGESWQDEQSPVRGLEKLASEIFNALAAMPEMISLLNTENLFKAVHLRQLPRVHEIYSPLFAGIRALLQRGEAAGVFRKGIDPIQLYISISALCYHYISNQHTFSVLFGFDLMNSRRLKVRREHTVDMVLRYCLTQPSAKQVEA
jgi:TetR/AcrR family transcriptional regulator